MMYLAAKHISPLCRVRPPDKGVRARGIEVPVKASEAQVKGTGVLAKGTGIDEMGFWRFRDCSIGQEHGWDMAIGKTCTNTSWIGDNEYEIFTKSLWARSVTGKF